MFARSFVRSATLPPAVQRPLSHTEDDMSNRQSAVGATTAQQLGSLIKSARDIMRKDKGLSGDLDRLPMLTWIMFLKFLDDMERAREVDAELSRERFRPAIE